MINSNLFTLVVIDKKYMFIINTKEKKNKKLLPQIKTILKVNIFYEAP